MRSAAPFPMSSLLISDALIELQTGVDVSTGDMRIAAEDGRLGEGDQDEPDQFRYSRFINFYARRRRRLLLDLWKKQWSVRATCVSPNLSAHPMNCFNVWIQHSRIISMFLGDSAHDDHGLNMATPKEEDSVHCSVRAPRAFLRPFTGFVDEIASTREYLRSSLDPPIHHRDLKPSNVLLDKKTENQLSEFGLSSRFLHANDYTTQIPRGSAVPTHNGPLDAKFLGKPSAKHGIEIKTGSHMTHRRTYLSVHHHPLMQMWPPARKWSGDIFTSCVRLIITSKRTFGDIFTAKPKYETPNAGPVSEYIIRKLFGIRNGLTVNESQQHSDPDSRRAKHAKMAVNSTTSASWIVATAAPHHATGDRNLLSGFTMEHDDLFVHAVNRVPMKVLARGAVVTDMLILPDVWFVPGLTENLVSVSQLAELDHSIGFGRGECCIRSARDAKIIGKGRLQKGGHYVLDYLKIPLAI